MTIYPCIDENLFCQSPIFQILGPIFVEGRIVYFRAEESCQEQVVSLKVLALHSQFEGMKGAPLSSKDIFSLLPVRSIQWTTESYIYSNL